MRTIEEIKADIEKVKEGDRLYKDGKCENKVCIYKTTDNYCELHSDGIDLREPCIKNHQNESCDDEVLKCNNPKMRQRIGGIEMKKYSWDFNENAEVWYSGEYDTIEDCLEAARVEADNDYQDKVYIGEVVPYIPRVDAESVLDQLQEQAYDEVGEVGYDWDAYDHKETDELMELQDKLNSVVREWLKKYDYYPNFYSIQNIKEYDLEVQTDE